MNTDWEKLVLSEAKLIHRLGEQLNSGLLELHEKRNANFYKSRSESALEQLIEAGPDRPDDWPNQE